MTGNIELRKKSIHDLRVMAQAFGVDDVFQKDTLQLAQAIELKRGAAAALNPPLPPRPEYDGRLMMATPADTSSPLEITELLTPHIRLGLKVNFYDDRWSMAWGKRSDDGTLRMPLRHILGCAEKVMRK